MNDHQQNSLSSFRRFSFLIPYGLFFGLLYLTFVALLEYPEYIPFLKLSQNTEYVSDVKPNQNADNVQIISNNQNHQNKKENESANENDDEYEESIFEAIEKPEAVNFTFQSLDGKKVQLSDYKGKIVIVNYWASWCSPCVAEMPTLNQIHSQLNKSEVVLLMINGGESLKTVRKAQARYAKNLNVFMDKNNEVNFALDIEAIPVTAIIDQEGRIRYRLEGQLNSENIPEVFSLIEELKKPFSSQPQSFKLLV